MTDDVFFHWLILVFVVILSLMRSRITLLILPISDLVGLISRQVGLLAKFGLWSLRVMKASLFAVMSTLSSMPSFVAIHSVDKSIATKLVIDDRVDVTANKDAFRFNPI